jgi:small subunit ribosomal protein S15
MRSLRHSPITLVRTMNNKSSTFYLLSNQRQLFHSQTLLTQNKLLNPKSYTEEEQNNNNDIDLEKDYPRVTEGQFEPSRHHLKRASKSVEDKSGRFMYPLRLDRHDNPVFNFNRFTAFNKARYPAIETNKIRIPKKPRHPYNPKSLEEVKKLIEFRHGVESDDFIAANATPVVRQIFSWENASQPEINSRNKMLAVKRFQTHPNDHGSPAVQIAVMTERIKYMSAHMQTHHQDKASARRLQILMNRRKKMMQYMRKKYPEQYWKVMRALDIKGKQAIL